MTRAQYQQKIGISAALFLVVAIAFVFFLFPWLLGKTAAALDTLFAQKRTVLELRQEQENIELAKKDIERIASQSSFISKLFDQDINLVEKIGQLEAQAARYGVRLNLTLSGTVATASKASTASELYVVPFTMRLSGSYASVVSYVRYVEQAGTVFTVRNTTLSTSGKDEVTVSLVGIMHLRK